MRYLELIKKPLLLLLLVVVVVFVVEMITISIMLVVTDLSVWQEGALSTFLLLVLALPLIWFGAIKPTNHKNHKLSEDKRKWESMFHDVEKFKLFVETSNRGFTIATLDKKIVYVNPALCEMLGYTQEEFLTQTFSMYYPSEAQEKLTQEVLPTVLRTGNWKGNLALLHKNGKQIFTDEDLFLIKDSQGKPLYFADVITDITKRQKVEELLQLNYDVMRSVKIGIMVADINLKTVMVNPAFTEITGYRKEDVVGNKSKILTPGDQDKEVYEEMWQSIKKTGDWEGEIWEHRKDRSLYPEWLNISSVKNKKGEVTHYVAIFQDITGRKKLEEKLKELARFDDLTKLNNRTSFEERVSQVVKQAKRDSGKVFLLFLDLDHFKDINDRYGHPLGDHLLKEMSRRMMNLLREEDIVARFGGDEFVICLPKAKTVAGAEQVAQKLMSEIAKPIDLDSTMHSMGVSIGISCFPDDTISVKELIVDADKAMYYVKHHGRANYKFFEKEEKEG